MKIEKEIRACVGDYVAEEKVKDLTGEIVYLFDKYKPAKMRRRFAFGLVIGMITTMLLILWAQ